LEARRLEIALMIDCGSVDNKIIDELSAPEHECAVIAGNPTHFDLIFRFRTPLSSGLDISVREHKFENIFRRNIIRANPIQGGGTYK
jgi:hypothetical protein